MTVTPLEALDIAEALKTAATGCRGVRQLYYELEARAEEWRFAADLLGDADEDAVIELFGNVNRGMRVLHDRHGFTRVIRKIDRGDQVSLHIESPESPQGYYRNFLDQTSPVVVRK